MPKSHSRSLVVDSNTGVVVAAPRYRSLIGRVVVNNGRRVSCDAEALNRIIWNDPRKPWTSEGLHAFAVPIERADVAGPIYSETVESMISGRGWTRDQAEATAEQILAWCPFSMQCAVCSLLVPGITSEKILAAVRAFKWVMIPAAAGAPGATAEGFAPACPACAIGFKSKPLPTDQEIAAMEAARARSV